MKDSIGCDSTLSLIYSEGKWKVIAKFDTSVENTFTAEFEVKKYGKMMYGLYTLSLSSLGFISPDVCVYVFVCMYLCVCVFVCVSLFQSCQRSM